MNPLINPWLIYFIGISDKLSASLSDLSGILFCISFCFLFLYAMGFIFENEPFAITLRRLFKWIAFISAPLALFCFVTSSLIPKQEWIIGMAVNSQITPNNLSVAGGAVKVAKDEMKKDFIDIIKELKSDKSKGETNKVETKDK